jgi:membrane protein YqaA with SNARE-associated domain
VLVEMGGRTTDQADENHGVDNTLAFLWGLGEATLFFLVPDVWLTFLAARGLKRGVVGSLYSLAGALIGGTAMYWLGAWHFESMVAFVERVPAIDAGMMALVDEGLRSRGVVAMLLGPLRGIPYKIYAIHSHGAGISYPVFLLASVPARWLRFLAVTAFAHYGLRAVKGWGLRVNPRVILAVAWSLFYIWYFAAHRG